MLDKFINEPLNSTLLVDSRNICLEIVSEILSEPHAGKIAENHKKSLFKLSVVTLKLHQKYETKSQLWVWLLTLCHCLLCVFLISADDRR